MVPIRRSQPAPVCLAQEAKKGSGDYKCGDVLDRLSDDGFGKCYICENNELLSIQVEHFELHQGDKRLKFDWNNLFFSCAHCNNTKWTKYLPMLNCCKAKDKVDRLISYRVSSFPKGEIFIVAEQHSTKVNNTVYLLEDIYSGTTKLKQIEAYNLRQKIIREMADFQQALSRDMLPELTSHLRSSSPFCAFKRWVIWDNPTLLAKYSKLMVNV